MFTRSALVAEARSFRGTPYHLGGQLKGVGVDCATFLYLVLLNCGIVPAQELEHVSHDWFAHATEEKYLYRLLRYAGKTAEGLFPPADALKPGCIALSKAAHSRVYNHGGIITEPPKLAHAIYPEVQEVRIDCDPLWRGKEIVVLDPWAKARTMREAV